MKISRTTLDVLEAACKAPLKALDELAKDVDWESNNEVHANYLEFRKAMNAMAKPFDNLFTSLRNLAKAFNESQAKNKA